MGRITVRRRVVRITAGGRVERPDSLAVEEPLEIRVDGQQLTVTMRTPGEDIDLALGLLVSEGLIREAHEVQRASYCPGGEEVLEVRLAPGVRPPVLSRSMLTSSACGVCGVASIDQVRRSAPFDLSADRIELSVAVLCGLPGLLSAGQRVFAATGGLHAAGLFTSDGQTLVVREDVGRHNAVDKVVGWALREGRLPGRGLVLQVSGRASFELTQKAWMAGIPVLAAVSAPSSLAVDLAVDAGMTLVGFSRGRSMNVYSASWRVAETPRARVAAAPRAVDAPRVPDEAAAPSAAVPDLAQPRA